jgi:ABC-2 type transport system permease protein
MTAGRRRRVHTVVIGFTLFALFMHGLAWLMLRSVADLTDTDHKRVLVMVSGSLAMAWSLMLSQALETVTRGFYARGDLELILSSPANASRLFAVRIAAMAVSIVGMSLVLAAPFINMLAWLGGAFWLCAYFAAVALGMAAVAVAVTLAMGLFRLIGPRRTRSVAQVAAAVIGAGFAVGVQFVAILTYGTTSRTAVMGSNAVVEMAPDLESTLWWPARAVLGEPAALLLLLAGGLALLALTIWRFAPRMGPLAIVAASAPDSVARRRKRPSRFRARSPAGALRRKEWVLLWRDPWLISQTLMQLLYLLPAALLLWRGIQTGNGAFGLLVPILIVAAGQLGGGLAWLAVSGEDAPELIACAPVAEFVVFRARTEAVLGAILMVFAPFLAVLSLVDPFGTLVALCGVLIAAASATAIQYWFRTQARRSLFRRRQTSSRVATFAEAAASTLWAGTGALVAAGSWFALASAGIVLVVLGGAWMLSPARTQAA